jgi:MoxR-like ATPase
LDAISELNPKMLNVLKKSKEHLLGKDEVLLMSFVSILSEGHLLLEDHPGVGKTTLVYILSKAFDFNVSRIQFTNDLLPSDIVGVSIFNPDKKEFQFKPGPLFGELVLADELNRATPKTQSALLQAMEESRVSVDGKEHMLDANFLVMATQNPFQQVGTYPLPESQLDRFFMSLEVGLPSREYEKKILTMKKGIAHIEDIPVMMNRQEMIEAKKEIADVYVSDQVSEYILNLLSKGRSQDYDSKGLSLRAGKDLVRGAKSLAWIYGRDFIVPDDVQALVPPIWGHRLGGAKGILYGQECAKELIQKVPVEL